MVGHSGLNFIVPVFFGLMFHESKTTRLAFWDSSCNSGSSLLIESVCLSRSQYVAKKPAWMGNYFSKKIPTFRFSRSSKVREKRVLKKMVARKLVQPSCSKFRLREAEAGATMVEFTLSIFVLFGLFALIFDGGLGVWKYTVLTDSLARVTSDRAIHVEANAGLATQLGVGGCGSCGGVEACVSNLAEALIAQRYPADGVNFRVSFPEEGPAGSILQRRFIKVDAEWPLSCVFCSVFNQSITLRASETKLLELSETFVQRKEDDGCF